MADRKQFLDQSAADPELIRLLSGVKQMSLSEADLQEQRISFAFGNALNRDFVTKDTVRHSSENLRMRAGHIVQR